MKNWDFCRRDQELLGTRLGEPENRNFSHELGHLPTLIAGYDIHLKDTNVSLHQKI